MNVTDNGVPVQDVIQAVKKAVKLANVSTLSEGRDLRISSVGLTLHAIATRSTGAGVNFHIPFIGMDVRLGAKVTRQDTHEIEINLTPPGQEGREEVRETGLEFVLTEAIQTIRAVVASAGGGDDPFVLNDGTVKIPAGRVSRLWR